MSDPVEYVLGTHDAEFQRLRFQHRLWADAAHAAWKRAGLRPGDRVLDVGCGPGFASLDLAEFVGPAGAVLGVDESAGFVAAANAASAARGLPHLRAAVCDVQRLGTLGGNIKFNLAYARWVLCFVPHPEAVVAGVYEKLAPGGCFVVHDYFNYASMTTAPPRASYTHVVQATARSWRKRGGDPDVVGRLPAMLQRQGFEVEHIELHARFAKPGESMFGWVSTWWRNYVPRLVEMGEITAADAECFMQDLAEVEASPTDFVVCPPVWEVVARKRA